MVRSNNDGNHDNSKSNDKNKNKNKNNNSMSLASYLRSSRSSLSSPSPSAPYNVVTGNQAADMDSIVSTIVLGYYLEVLRRHRGDDKNENADNADNADADNALHIPLLPLPSSPLRLRPDVLSLFSLLLTPLSPPPPPPPSSPASPLPHPPLTFRSTFDPRGTLPPGYTLTLVDHNAVDYTYFPEEAFGGGKGRVRGIVDHHRDMGYHGEVSGASRNIAFDGSAGGGGGVGAALVGSCCTLITEMIFPTNDSSVDSSVDSSPVDFSFPLAVPPSDLRDVSVMLL